MRLCPRTDTLQLVKERKGEGSLPGGSTSGSLENRTKRSFVKNENEGSCQRRALGVYTWDSARGHDHHPGPCPRQIGDIRRSRAQTAESLISASVVDGRHVDDGGDQAARSPLARHRHHGQRSSYEYSLCCLGPSALPARDDHHSVR